MKECIICGKAAKIGYKKALKGYICKDCRRMLPKSIKYDTSETDYLRRLYHANLEKKKIFECTASLGSLYIDSLNGLVCISKSGKKGKPLEFHDIYSLDEISNVGLFCTDIKNIGTNSNIIVCNVKFRIVTDNISNEFIIFRNKRCPFKEKGKEVECREPLDVIMFRNVFNQMLDDKLYAAIEKLKIIRAAKEKDGKVFSDVSWAKGVLFIDEKEEYTQSSLKEKRNLLVKIFHTDINKSGDDAITAMINRAYETLS